MQNHVLIQKGKALLQRMSDYHTPDFSQKTVEEQQRAFNLLSSVHSEVQEMVTLAEMSILPKININRQEPSLKKYSERGDLECGELVRVKPVDARFEGKTFLAFFVGEIVVASTVEKTTDALNCKYISYSPLLFIPSIGEVLIGTECWITKIKTEEDFDGTQDDMYYEVAISKFQSKMEATVNENQESTETEEQATGAEKKETNTKGNQSVDSGGKSTDGRSTDSEVRQYGTTTAKSDAGTDGNSNEENQSRSEQKIEGLGADRGAENKAKPSEGQEATRDIYRGDRRGGFDKADKC